VQRSEAGQVDRSCKPGCYCLRFCFDQYVLQEGCMAVYGG
jgi:hypothetical protein